MTRTLLFALLFLTSAFRANAQEQFTIKGVITDTSSNVLLENAIISILNAKDSILISFMRTKENGGFLIGNMAKGRYIITVSYPRYIDLVESFTLDSIHPLLDLGRINMLPLSQLLKTAVVINRRPIRIKNDTTEYDASKFVIQPNARVEDLLAQLPGVQVDKNGIITAQGQQVNKVLVDGEEFFGDDPTLVTRNIRADMVDKVQIYDKKSDQTSFNGVDDGKKTKTINIKLKEDKKNGMFGKVDAGAATSDYYQGQAMYNYFNADQKIAVYGTTGNTGTIGLSWQDNNKYAPSNNIQIDDNNIPLPVREQDELEGSQYKGQGIPLIKSGGIHYDTKWNDKKESINSNYKIGFIEVDGNGHSIDENDLPTGIINNLSNYNFNNTSFRQKLDTKYTALLDSTATLQLSGYGLLKDGHSGDSYESTGSNGENLPLNQSSRKINDSVHSNAFGASALWNKKLRKAGRTISIGLNQTIDIEDRKGSLISQNEYFNSQGNLDSTQLIDQKKNSNARDNAFYANLAYTEPLTRYSILSLTYGINLYSENSNLFSYNKSPTGDYTALDTLYSNNYKLEQHANFLKAILNYAKDKNVISLGLSATNINFNQLNLFNDSSLKRNFKIISPSAQWTHNFPGQKSIRINYDMQTILPAISQMQPVRNNSDPLNISIGNPDLDPAFRHSLTTTYNSYKVLSGQYFSFSFTGSLTPNDIISNIKTDSAGNSTFKYENLKGYNSFLYSSYLYYGRKIKSINLQVGGVLSYTGSSLFSVINNETNKTYSNTLTMTFNASRRIAKKYSINVEAGPIYTSNISSLQAELPDKGWGFKAIGSCTVFLPAKFDASTDANYEYSPANKIFDNSFTRLIWNGQLRRRFLKKENLSIGIMVNDILNQNEGFTKAVSKNVITETYYSTVSRYFMITATWDFNKLINTNNK